MSDDRFLEVVARYNARRNQASPPFYSVCFAPFSSLYFDQLGNALACCHNRKHVLGNITRESLRAIWDGEKASKLRAALRRNDLRQGCSYCEKEFLLGNDFGSFMRRFDDFTPEGDPPVYPKLLEFSVSNTCNLECVQCNGEWSSSIRTRREKLPPIPKVYGEKFYQELREFLPHLQRANWYGGEPFLQQEAYRVWDLMIELEVRPDNLVTSNGTQYNSRIERILDRLPFSFSFSIDGVTKETYEKVRQNARFDEVMANLQRFREYTREKGTFFGLSHCLMVPNWQEFGEFLLWADQIDADAYVTLVTFPKELSIESLPIAELCRIVDGFEAQDAHYLSRLVRNRAIWTEQLERLRHARDFALNPAQYTGLAIIERSPEWGILPLLQEPTTESAPSDDSWARETLEAWSRGGGVGWLVIDSSWYVRAANIEPLGIAHLKESDLVDQPLSRVQHLFQAALGPHREQLRSDQRERYIEDVTLFENKTGERSLVRALTLPSLDEKGNDRRLTLYLACRRPVTPEECAEWSDGPEPR